MKEYKTIKEFYTAVKSGKIDESELTIILDNDCTGFYAGEEEIRVAEANGYYDIEKLYPLLFPKATVEWC